MPFEPPQFVISYWMCEKINESYIKSMAEMDKYRCSLFITPNVRDIVLAFLSLSSHSYIYLHFPILALSWWWNIKNLDFLTLCDSFLTKPLNHFCQF